MKERKYITTKENLIFREGINVEFTKGTFVHEPYYDKKENVIRVHDTELDFYVHNKGYIKEVQEPEFNRDDMLGFGERMQGHDCEVGYCLDVWINENK